MYPHARHSGRPYVAAHEEQFFHLERVDQLLAQWRWTRLVGSKSGQISFADRNVRVGKGWAGQIVHLRFDPTDRQVVIFGPSTAPDQPGPELKRFVCSDFTDTAIRGHSALLHPHDTSYSPRGGTTL